MPISTHYVDGDACISIGAKVHEKIKASKLVSLSDLIKKTFEVLTDDSKISFVTYQISGSNGIVIFDFAIMSRWEADVYFIEDQHGKWSVWDVPFALHGLHTYVTSRKESLPDKEAMEQIRTFLATHEYPQAKQEDSLYNVYG